jgi:hypothetical protein
MVSTNSVHVAEMNIEEIRSALQALPLAEQLQLSEELESMTSTFPQSNGHFVRHKPNESSGDFSPSEQSILTARSQTEDSEYIPWDIARDGILLRLMSRN